MQITFKSNEYEDIYYLECPCGGAIEIDYEMCEGDYVECDSCSLIFKLSSFDWNIDISAKAEGKEKPYVDTSSFEARHHFECDCGEDLEVDISDWCLEDVCCEKCDTTYEIDVFVSVEIQLDESTEEYSQEFNIPIYYGIDFLDMKQNLMKQFFVSLGEPSLKDVIEAFQKTSHFNSLDQRRKDEISKTNHYLIDTLEPIGYFELIPSIKFQMRKINEWEFNLNLNTI